MLTTEAIASLVVGLPVSLFIGLARPDLVRGRGVMRGLVVAILAAAVVTVIAKWSGDTLEQSVVTGLVVGAVAGLPSVLASWRIDQATPAGAK